VSQSELFFIAKKKKTFSLGDDDDEKEEDYCRIYLKGESPKQLLP
jgi:hypothetical protein